MFMLPTQVKSHFTIKSLTEHVVSASGTGFSFSCCAERFFFAFLLLRLFSATADILQTVVHTV